MYSNNILDFQEPASILNPCTKKSLETYWKNHVIYIRLYRTEYIDAPWIKNLIFGV